MQIDINNNLRDETQQIINKLEEDMQGRKQMPVLKVTLIVILSIISLILLVYNVYTLFLLL